MLLRSSLRTQGFLSPVNQRLLFRIREPGGRVHRKVIPRRHFAFFHLLSDVFGVFLWATPLREIEMAASAIHISLDKPGHGRHVGIPGPDGCIAVAIETGAAKEFSSLRRIPGWLAGCGRVGVAVAIRNKLDQDGCQQ